eukprot:2908605-Pyramimonas_sp.AAC.1
MTRPSTCPLRSWRDPPLEECLSNPLLICIKAFGTWGLACFCPGRPRTNGAGHANAPRLTGSVDTFLPPRIRFDRRGRRRIRLAKKARNITRNKSIPTSPSAPAAWPPAPSQCRGWLGVV